MEKLVRFTKKNDFLIAEVLINKLDLFETPHILDSVEKAIFDQNLKGFVIDFKNVLSIDSSGLGFLIAVRNKLAKVNLQLSVVNVGDTVMQIFRLTKIVQLIRIYETIDEIPGADGQ